MLIMHVYILGKNGGVERSYDFMRNNGKEALEGCDLVVPYDEENEQPMTERSALAIISNEHLRGDH